MRWWQGWEPAEMWRIAVFAIPAAIIATAAIAYLTGGY